MPFIVNIQMYNSLKCTFIILAQNKSHFKVQYILAPNKKVATKVKWTTEEEVLVLQFFASDIQNRKFPGNINC